MEAATGGELVLVADRTGRYVDGNEALLEALGYTLDELRALPVGGLTNAEAEVSAEVWALHARGEIEFPGNRPIALRRKSGDVVDATLIGIKRRTKGQTWTITMRLGTPKDGDPRPALHAILGEWRALERLRDSLADGDPTRGQIEARIASVRELYHAETKRRQKNAREP